MKIDVSFVVVLIIAFSIALPCAYLFLAHTYGNKDPKKWKSILFSKKDTLRTVIFPNKGRGKSDNDLN